MPIHTYSYGQIIKILKGETYKLLSISEAALVTSGTATLETALFDVPEVVCYKGSAISYAIGKRLIKVPYIALVNLIMNQPIVKELIQDELTPENIKSALENILPDGAARKDMIAHYKQLQDLLRAGGAASEKAATIICGMS